MACACPNVERASPVIATLNVEIPMTIFDILAKVCYTRTDLEGARMLNCSPAGEAILHRPGMARANEPERHAPSPRKHHMVGVYSQMHPLMCLSVDHTVPLSCDNRDTVSYGTTVIASAPQGREAISSLH
jgi:hypothetical protein